MGRLLYSVITSLDGYVVDAEGRFDWSMPDEEVHAFINDQQRSIGTYLYGRRLYEVMLAWETLDLDGQDDIMVDFARVWRRAEKVVFSRTLKQASSRRTRLEPELRPDDVRQLVDRAPEDVSVGGPTLAAQALHAGIVDECHFFVSPVVVGGGTRALPDGLRLDLDLLQERRFANGVVHTQYRCRRDGARR